MNLSERIIYTYFSNPSQDEVIGKVVYLPDSETPEYFPHKMDSYSFYRLQDLKIHNNRPVIIFQNEQSADLGLIEFESIISLSTEGGPLGLGDKDSRFFLAPESVRILKELRIYIFPEFNRSSFRWANQLSHLLLTRYQIYSEIFSSSIVYQFEHSAQTIGLESLLKLGLNEEMIRGCIKDSFNQKQKNQVILNDVPKELPVVSFLKDYDKGSEIESMVAIKGLIESLCKEAKIESTFEDSQIQSFKDILFDKDRFLINQMINEILLMDDLLKTKTLQKLSVDPVFFERCYIKYYKKISERTNTVNYIKDSKHKCPNHEENILWYSSLSEDEKKNIIDKAVNIHFTYLEMLNFQKLNFLENNFTQSNMFELLMQLIGRSPW